MSDSLHGNSALSAGLVLAALLAGSPASTQEPMPVDDFVSGPTFVTTGPAATADTLSPIDAAWLDNAGDPATRLDRTRMTGFRFGVHDLEAAARSLITPGASGSRSENARAAVRLAPGLPIALASLARAEWAEGQHSSALQALVAALVSMPAHLEASLWLAASLLVLLGGVLVLASGFFIASVGVRCASHAAHDLGDAFTRSTPEWARAAMLASLVLLPLCLGEGIAGVLVLLFALGMAYSDNRHRLTLVLAALLLWSGLVPVAGLAGRSLVALESAPIVAASLSATHASQTPAELQRLQHALPDDLLARQTLAAHARRNGDVLSAERHYEALLDARADDPVVLVNLANLKFERGETEAAAELYMRALQRVESTAILFDLSQAHARLFQMDEFEAVMQRAQSLDPKLVAEFSGYADPNFVVDLPLPTAALRDRLLATQVDGSLARSLTQPLAPGLLGAPGPQLALVLALVAVLAMLLPRFYTRSARCSHCGCRVCRRCRLGRPADQICDACDRVLNRPETTDAQLRKARLATMRERERRVAWASRWAALLIPGAAGLLARRPGLGLIGALLFAWVVASLLFREGLVADPLVVGFAGPLALLLSGALAGLAYLIVLSAGNHARERM